jgi:hypothetical protein
VKDLTQKKCPELFDYVDPDSHEEIKIPCGKPAVKISRDRYGKRTCEDGHEWYPSKRKGDEE